MAKTLEEHYSYLSDATKIERYRAAIGTAVRPGDVVVDLGCGTGLLGLMALEAGAGKVYFIEEGSIIEVARKTIANAGFDGKAEFFKQNSFELVLPEKADVIVCDHVGFFAFDYGILALLADAKDRFLKPGGVMIPTSFDLKLAPVESEESRKLVGQWQNGSVPDEFSWLAATSANTKHAVQLKSDELIAEIATLQSLSLGQDSPAFLSASTEFQCIRDGVVDGLAGFFECRLFNDVTMTNSPAADDAIERPQAFLPLENPAEVKKGDTIKATVMARPEDSLIAWVVEFPDSGERFEYTTFNGLLLDQSMLTMAQPNRVANLNDQGRAIQVVLSYCNGQRTLADVQDLIKQEHPDLFPSEQASESFVRRTLTWITKE